MCCCIEIIFFDIDHDTLFFCDYAVSRALMVKLQCFVIGCLGTSIPNYTIEACSHYLVVICREDLGHFVFFSFTIIATQNLDWHKVVVSLPSITKQHNVLSLIQHDCSQQTMLVLREAHVPRRIGHYVCSNTYFDIHYRKHFQLCRHQDWSIHA